MTQTAEPAIETPEATFPLPTLDKTRDYGTIHGECEHGSAYSQDGFRFDSAGELIEAYLTDKDRARLLSIQKRHAALEQARERFKAVASDMTEEEINKVVNLQALSVQEDEEIDLAAWANGKAYNYLKVVKKIRELYGRAPRDRNQCLEILSDNGVIPPRAGFDAMPPTGQR